MLAFGTNGNNLKYFFNKAPLGGLFISTYYLNSGRIYLIWEYLVLYRLIS
jgi:hypothetical protein